MKIVRLIVFALSIAFLGYVIGDSYSEIKTSDAFRSSSGEESFALDCIALSFTLNIFCI